MTKKEKKEFALKLKAEIDAKHIQKKTFIELNEEKLKKYHEGRYRGNKRKSKDDEMYWQLRRKFYD